MKSFLILTFVFTSLLGSAGENKIALENKVSFWYSNNLDSALYYSKKLELLQGLTQIEKAKNYRLLASILKTQSNYALAISYLFEAIKIYEQEGEENETFLAQVELIKTAAQGQRIDIAYNHIEELKMVLPTIEDSLLRIQFHCAKGYFHERNEESILALKEYESAKHLNKYLNLTKAKIEIIEGIASVYEDMGSQIRARLFYKELDSLLSNDLTLYIDNLNNIGDTYRKSGEPLKSKLYYKKALTLSLKHTYKKGIMQNLADMAYNYKDLGNIDSAYIYLERHYDYYKAAFNEATTSSITQFELLYNLEKQESETRLQKSEADLKSAQLNTLLLVSILITLGGIFFFFIAISLRRKNKVLKLQQREIENQNDLLRSQHEEITKLSSVLEKDIEQKNSQINEYLRLNSHEIRNPLSKILGLADVLELEKNAEDQLEMILALKESAKQLDQVLYDMNHTLSNKKPNKD